MSVQSNQRWAPICQDCWYLACPGDYFPDTMHYGDCVVCGMEGGIITHVHPEVAREAKAELDARTGEE